jgi:NAD+ diphosphatase
MPDQVPYTGATLDRAPAQRADEQWVLARLADPDAIVLPMWQDKCVVSGAVPVRLACDAAAAVLAASPPPVFLGLDGDAGVFAVDLSDLDEAAAVALCGGSQALDVRALFAVLSAAEAAVLAYAKGILRWNREQRFCGACGAAAQPRDGGHLRICTGCERLLFPRIEPAVIVLVEAPLVPGQPDRCLLARHVASVTGAFSTLAGFIEIGESLEEAVRREIAEEAGVQLGTVTYQASQPWPFPSGLMIGFRARALSEEVCVDGVELAEARWFTRSELRAEIASGRQRRPDSIESHLIDTWLRGD